jgi:hypothetical protein
MSLQIRATKHQLADLKRISELEATALSGVQQSLADLKKPALHPEELLSTVRNELGDDAEPVVRQLLSLYGLIRRSGSTVEDVISGVRDAISQQGQDVGLELTAWSNVEGVFQSLLQDRNVRLAAAAIELSYDYANLLQRTKILTDIRPLFNEVGDEIEAAVVSYTLRLHFSTSEGDHELSVALDESDVKMLRAQCDRAITKANTARSLVVDSCNIPVTGVGDSGND